MMEKLYKLVLKAGIITLILSGVSFAVWYFRKESGLTLKDALFWVGAGPIALFTLTFFGGFVGRSDFGYQYASSVLPKSANDRAVQDKDDVRSRFLSNLAWIMSGAILWLVSYFI